jgi:hypothetical protein
MRFILFAFFIALGSAAPAQSNGSNNGVFIPSAISNRSPTVLQYTQALKYCSNLVEGGYSDWRLPRSEEIEAYIFSGGSISSNGILTWVRGDFKVLDPLYGTVAGFVFSIDSNYNGQIFSKIESQGSNGTSSGPIGTNFCHCVR